MRAGRAADMGPITGVRLVNLRVRDKVAYPDLTLDLRGDRPAGHVVVGLENGGGKSTLLGAVFHVFVPEANEFLPRRAMRRQGKEGEEKRLEHYVPGGDPTHVVVELEPAAQQQPGARLLVGACLHKPAGSPAAHPAKEFFWSARCTVPELTIRHLGLRGPGGRLLDHRELRAWLLRLRQEVPAAQVTVEDGKGNWEQHLRDLGVDVDYVRRFLLRMNEDEGAADQVFTYASSRAFLNSLVGTVSDPGTIAGLKQSLAAMAVDADAMLLDRRRVVLLEGLAGLTATLADLVGRLDDQVGLRDRAVDGLLAGRGQLEAARRECHTVATAHEREHRARERALADARTAYYDLGVRAALARVQTAELRLAAADARIGGARRQLGDDRLAERAARAAALLARRRTAAAGVAAVEETLAAKALGAEPHRRALASAVQGWRARLDTDIRLLEDQRDAQRRRVTQEDDTADAAEQARADAAEQVGVLTGTIRGLSGEQRRLSDQLAAAVNTGDLGQGEDPAAVVERARAEAAAADQAADARERERHAAAAAVTDLEDRDGALRGDEIRAEAAAAAAAADLERAAGRTDQLAGDLARSGLVELDPVVLDDHAEAVVERLTAVVDEARVQQAGAAVRAAAAERAATWLEGLHILPPRADVERLCDRARSSRLGARPGWSYLAELPEDVAAKYAAAHPGLADGVVVNVPEDLDRVVGLVGAARAELDGPVIVGSAAAFDESADVGGEVVVLPDAAFWSPAAGQAIAPARLAEAGRHQQEVGELAGRVEEALTLRGRVHAWSAEVGAGGVARRRAEVARLARGLAELSEQRAALAALVGLRRAERDRAAADRDAARQRGRERESLAARVAPLVGAWRRLAALAQELGAAEARRRAAETAQEDARSAAAQARDRRDDAARRAEEQTGAITPLLALRSDVAALAQTVVRDGDAVDAQDAGADRESLASRSRHLETVWRGAITDPELRARLDHLREDLADLERGLLPFADVAAAAETRAAERSRAAADHEADADAARLRVEALERRLGGLDQLREQRAGDLEAARSDHRALRRPGELGAGERSGELGAAEAIEARLRAARDGAAEARTAAEQEVEAAAAVRDAVAGRISLVEEAATRLLGAARQLAAGGRLVPALDLDDRESGLVPAVVPDGAPAALPALLVAIGGRPADPVATLTADRQAATRLLGDLDGEADALRRTLAALEQQAGDALEGAEALLRDASDDVVRGDQLVQLLRRQPGRQLAALAVAHHDDIVQRRDSVRHHVDRFNARIEALAETVHATIAGLLREVSRTVRDSQLPTTPAMGRWAGLPLLKLGGRSLPVDERKAAVAGVLHTWFDPERPDARPRSFDGDGVVHQLLEAATPQFSARILVPSDPLDPDHKPVDHLALETSGGEGVTVALILAALLASRRASARGHRRTTLLLDNPFAKVTKPEFLRLARDVADGLDVQLVALTGIRDIDALTVFPTLVQLRVSRRDTANVVVPAGIDDDRLQPLLRAGTLAVSPVEWDATAVADDRRPDAWPVMSTVTVHDRTRAGGTGGA